MHKSTPCRARRSRDTWQRLIEAQRNSYRSQQAFCQQQGLALSTFQNWKR